MMDAWKMHRNGFKHDVILGIYVEFRKGYIHVYMYICIYVNIYIYISICIYVVTQATRGPLFSLCEVVFSLVNPTNWKDMKPRNFEVGNQASKSSNLNITHLRVISHKFDMF